MQATSSFGIGRLAELSGLPVKTIRFYSDLGILRPGRTEAGHRRYDAADLARVQLVHGLRELGVGLPEIRALLEEGRELRHVLGAHANALEVRIRGLQRQLVVTRAAAADPSPAALRRLETLARLDADERRRLLEGFWDAVGTQGPLREAGTPELPADPSPEQLDAWLELAQLAIDEDFQRTTRENAAWGQTVDPSLGPALELARAAIDQGLAPDAPEAAPAVDAFARAWAEALGREDRGEFRAWLAGELAARSDPRAERYWQLVGTLRGEPADGHKGGPAARGRAFQWLLSGLAGTASGH